MEKIELLFGWTGEVTVAGRYCGESVTRSQSRNHTIHSHFIPRIGETVDLGYIELYSQYVEKKVVDVRYAFNSNYVYIELES